MATNTKHISSFPAGVLLGGLILGIFIGLASGFLIGKNMSVPEQPSPQQAQETDRYSRLSPFFSDHTAIVQGKLKSLNGTTLTVEDMKGASVDLELNDPVYISKAATNNTPSNEPTSTDVKDIEIGKNALVTLRETKGEFKVWTITILPDLQTPRPLPSPK